MEANYFTILYWFCHTSTWICHRCTHVPHSEPPSPPGDLPDPGIKPASLALAGGFFYRCATGNAYIYRHTMFLLCFTLLYFTDIVFFTNLMFVAALRQTRVSASFFKQHLLILCLCHILVILTVFQRLLLILYLLWWSFINDLKCCYYASLKACC